MLRALTVLLALALTACSKKPGDGLPRAELRVVSGVAVEVVPAEEQLPFCLVFTTSEKGVIRQLTMTRENLSVPCVAGAPIGKVAYRIPVEEGPVKIHVFFSDQKINAGSIAQQVFDMHSKGTWSAMDLRLPGKVFLEVLDFTPKASAPETTGGVIGSGGTIQDAGTN